MPDLQIVVGGDDAVRVEEMSGQIARRRIGGGGDVADVAAEHPGHDALHPDGLPTGAGEVCVTDSMNDCCVGTAAFGRSRSSASRKSLLNIKSVGASFSYSSLVARTSSRQYSAISRCRPARYHASTDRPSSPSPFDV